MWGKDLSPPFKLTTMIKPTMQVNRKLSLWEIKSSLPNTPSLHFCQGKQDWKLLSVMDRETIRNQTQPDTSLGTHLGIFRHIHTHPYTTRHIQIQPDKALPETTRSYQTLSDTTRHNLLQSCTNRYYRQT